MTFSVHFSKMTNIQVYKWPSYGPFCTLPLMDLVDNLPGWGSPRNTVEPVIPLAINLDLFVCHDVVTRCLHIACGPRRHAITHTCSNFSAPLGLLRVCELASILGVWCLIFCLQQQFLLTPHSQTHLTKIDTEFDQMMVQTEPHVPHRGQPAAPGHASSQLVSPMIVRKLHTSCFFYTCAHKPIHTYIRTHDTYVHTHTHTRMHVYTCTHTHTHTRTRTHTHRHAQSYTYTCIHMYAYDVHTPTLYVHVHTVGKFLGFKFSWIRLNS